MTEWIVRRWSRFGHDRVYAATPGGTDLGYLDLATGRFEPVAFCPGFLRGLTIVGNYAVVGLSRPRENRTFSGLPLDEKLKQSDSEARCALQVIDLKTGDVVHWLRIEGIIEELYDVVVLPGVQRPMAIGFVSDEIRRILTVDDGGFSGCRHADDFPQICQRTHRRHRRLGRPGFGAGAALGARGLSGDHRLADGREGRDGGRRHRGEGSGRDGRGHVER